MYYQKDYLMRLIEDLIRFIAMVLFGKKAFQYEIIDDLFASKTDTLHAELMALVAQRRLGEAEDMLFDAIEPGQRNGAMVALDFYQTLNALSDDELDAADFSREEIKDGLKQITALYGINIEGIF